MESLSPAEVLEELTECCEIYEDAYDDYYEEEDCPGIDLQMLWTTLIEIAKNDVPMLSNFYPQLDILVEYDPDFRGKNPEIVGNLVKEFNNSSKTNDEKAEIMLQLDRLLPFFDEENTSLVIDGMINLCDSLLHESNKIPVCMSRAIKEVVSSSMKDQTLIDIFNKLQEAMKTEKKAAATICLACFSDTLIERLGYGSALLDNVKQCIDTDNITMITGFYLLSKIAPSLGVTDDIKTDEIVPILIPSLACNDTDRRESALVAFRSLAENDVILERSSVQKFVDSFSEFKGSEGISIFFKCLRIIIRSSIDLKNEELNIEEEDFDEDPADVHLEEEEIQQEDEEEENEDCDNCLPIRDFLLVLLRSSPSEEIMSETICTISNIVKYSSNMFHDSRKDILEIINKQIDLNNIQLYLSISLFMKCAFESNFISSTGKLAYRMKKLIQGALRQEVDNYDKVKIANNLASFARSVRKCFVKPLYQIGSECISTDDDEIASICASTLGSLARSLNEEEIIKTFDEVSNRAINAENHKLFEEYMKQMTQIISNKFITVDKVKPFLNKIINSEVPYLNGKQINKALPSCVEAFRFMRAAIILGKFPDAINYIMTAIKDAKRLVTVELIKCGVSAVEKGLFTKEKLHEFTDIVIKQFNDLSVEQENAVTASADFLRLAYLKDHSIFDVDEIIESVSSFVDDIRDDSYYDDNDDEDDQETNSETMTSLSMLIFTIYMENPKLKVNNKLCKNLLNLTTISTYDEHTPLLLTTLVKMYQEDNRFNCIQVASLQTFATILTISQKLRDELELDEKIIDSMKQMIIEAVSYDQSFIPLITEDISKSEKKMARFRKFVPN